MGAVRLSMEFTLSFLNSRCRRSPNLNTVWGGSRSELSLVQRESRREISLHSHMSAEDLNTEKQGSPALAVYQNLNIAGVP